MTEKLLTTERIRQLRDIAARGGRFSGETVAWLLDELETTQSAYEHARDEEARLKRELREAEATIESLRAALRKAGGA